MKEFRVCLHTQAGQLAQVSEALSHRNINILTLAAVQATALITALAVVVSKEQEEETRTTLQGLGLHCEERELITLKLPNQPGELFKLTQKLAESHVNIESIYFMGIDSGEEVLILSVDELERAKEVLDVT